MNPQLHDEFVALVPLHCVGELTEEEWALLQIHLAYCESCRSAFNQYKHIASEVIPAMAASAASDAVSAPQESDREIADAERRLMESLADRGTQRGSQEHHSATKRVLIGALAASAILSSPFWAFRWSHRGSRQVASRSPREHLSMIPAPVPAPGESVKEAKDRTQREIAELRQQLADGKDRPLQPKEPDPAIQQQLEADRVQQQRLVAEKDAVTQELAAARTDAQSLRDKIASTQETADQQAGRNRELDAKVRDLNASLDETNTALADKERILALDKDFLAHDRDIRDLIGARNLYIADIIDTNENGKTAKPFGRIFYTKDRSLVFYGFDLEKQAGLKQSVAFQAWGSGSDKQPTSLGLFYQDDSNKRWVLRCNDPKTLARMNMVFVTVEPVGGSDKPTGKQLLRAYLQIQPNHL